MGHGRRPIHSDELRLLCTGDAPGGSAPRRPHTNDADAGLRPCGRHRDDAVAGRGRPRPGRRDRAPPWPPPLRGAAGGPSPTRPRAPPAGGRPDGEPGPGGPSPTPVDAVPSAVEGAWPGGDPGTRWHPVPPLRPFPRGPSSPPGGPRPTGGPGGTGARRPRPRPSAPLGGRIVGGGGPGPLGLSAFAPGARSAWRAALGAGGARGRPRGRPARCRPWPVRCPGSGTPPTGGAGVQGKGEPNLPVRPLPEPWLHGRPARGVRGPARREPGPSGARPPAHPAAVRPPSGRAVAGRSVPDVSPSLCRAEASLGPGLPRGTALRRGPRRAACGGVRAFPPSAREGGRPHPPGTGAPGGSGGCGPRDGMGRAQRGGRCPFVVAVTFRRGRVARPTGGGAHLGSRAAPPGLRPAPGPRFPPSGGKGGPGPGRGRGGGRGSINPSGAASKAGEGPVVAGSGFRTLCPRRHAHGGALKKGAFGDVDHVVVWHAPCP